MADRFQTHVAFSWCELLTNDVASAKKFYKELLDRKMEDEPIGEGAGTYTILKVNSQPIGGIMAMPPQVPPGTPPHLGTYVTVDDVDSVAQKAQELGTKILVPPTYSPDVRFCVFEDPQRAFLSIITYSKKTDRKSIRFFGKYFAGLGARDIIHLPSFKIPESTGEQFRGLQAAR